MNSDTSCAPPSRSLRFFYSSVTTALYQIALFAAGFITPKIMLVYYSSEINGLVTSISQFITYFNLVEAGLSGAAVYALYKPLANNDYPKISSIVVAAQKFYLQAGKIFVFLILALAVGYPLFIRTSLSFAEVAILIFILGANSILEFYTLAKYRAILTADQKTYVISIASTIHVILNTGIIFILAHFKINIVWLRAIALCSIFVRTWILMLYVRKRYPDIDYRAVPDTKSLDKRWDAMYMQILGALHTGAPIIILTFVLKDLLLVSVFCVYNIIITGLHGVMSIFSGGISSSFGDVIVRNQKKTLQSTFQQFELGYLSLMTVIYSTAMVLIMPFIRIYTAGITDTTYEVPMIGFLIVLNGFFYNLKSPNAMLLIAAGLYKESRVQTSVQGLIMIVLGCLFGYWWHIEGILIACILSNLYRDIDLLFFIPRHVTRLPIRNTLKRWFLAALSFIFVTLIFRTVEIRPADYISWIGWACIITPSSCIVVLSGAYLFDREALFGLFSQCKRLLIKTI